MRWVVVAARLPGSGKVKWLWVAVSVGSKGCHMQELDKQWGRQRAGTVREQVRDSERVRSGVCTWGYQRGRVGWR